MVGREVIIMTIIDEISQLIEDFQANYHKDPEVLVLNRNHKRDIFASVDYNSIVTIDMDGYPKRIMGLLPDVVDVPAMYVRGGGKSWPSSV
jgi:hypothetical protein